MPALQNPKYELFAQELAKGLPADKAYEAAGFKPNRGNAVTLKQKQSILDRVSELLAEREAIHGQATADAIKSTALTKDWIINALRENLARAMQAKPAKVDDQGNPIGEYQYQGNVANRALELLGKELGMFIERKELTGKDGGPIQTEEKLAESARNKLFDLIKGHAVRMEPVEADKSSAKLN